MGKKSTNHSKTESPTKKSQAKHSLSGNSPKKKHSANKCTHFDGKSIQIWEQVIKAVGRPLSTCTFCSEHTSLMYSCLECNKEATYGCWSQGVFHLATGHLGPSSGHFLSALAGSGPEGLIIYCSKCHCHVWNTALQFFSDNYRYLRKDRLFKQLQLIGLKGQNPVACVQVRGLINLGKTCFMNAILQALLHDPHLVRYFMNSQHEPNTCRLKTDCIACHLDGFYQEMYSGATGPFSPTKLLQAMWMFCKGLAGYEQQDSHEFLISLLQLLHSHLADRAFGCDCVVHGIFSGVLESSVTCGRCGTLNAVYDPFMDISLQVPEVDSVSLLECICQFTKPETLAPKAYTCASCSNSESQAIKQLKFRKLPKTLILHLKRFKHDGTTGGKVNCRMNFPLQFSMYPFLTNYVERNVFSQGMKNKYCYRLYAVIAHLGNNLDSGHYTIYLNMPPFYWLQINDSVVGISSFEEVLNAPAYLLFYSRLSDDNDNSLYL